MANAVPLVELWRGDLLESQHLGHVAVYHADDGLVDGHGDTGAVIYPRSSCKILQALPLMRSGAAKRARLTSEQLALACASHQGAAIHTDRVTAWLKDMGLGNDDLRCGPQAPADIPARDGLIKADQRPCRIHNNCSGKHVGFLTLAQDMKAGPEYHLIDHPVQIAIKAAHEEMTEEVSPNFGIDGCSAPNHACTVTGLARAMAKCAASMGIEGELRDAMMMHPDLVAGETRACTELMRAVPGVALKTGAEAVYTAMIPDRKIGIALKIVDGSTRGAEAVIAQLLINMGLLDAAHPAALKRVGGPLVNFAGLEVGRTVAVI
ncbi:MAG: asparaginase [Planktomarina sp.]